MVVEVKVAQVSSRVAGVYIGRSAWAGGPSPLGNPFVLGRDGNREVVIAKYEQWLERALRSNAAVQSEFARLVALAQRPGGVVLLCHCTPLACHGDVLKAKIEEQIQNQKEN